MSVTLQITKYPQEGDLQHTYGALKNISIDNPEGSEEEGQIVDLTLDNSKSLNLDLEHPVNVECQPSYDGTVNLILNDDKNPPRIINSRFSKIEDNRFKIITRNQVSQTNLYDRSKFDQQTRLFRTSNTIPKIDLINVYNSGQLLGGNYTFYIRLGDEDDNLSDIVAESGMVSIFKGYASKPSSVSGTIYDEATDKAISLKISNLDTSYSNVHIYFSRETCDQNGIKLTKYGKINTTYPILDKDLIVSIRGTEPILDITDTDLNIQYNIVSAVKTQAQVQNMLFFGNVQQQVLDIKNLQNLSYYIQVTLKQDNEGIGYINEKDYTGQENSTIRQLEYYSPLNIYYKLGYWPDELYRLGVVYIMNDDSLTPVFDLRGCAFSAEGESNYDTAAEITDFLKPRSSILSGIENMENTYGVFKLPKLSIFPEENETIKNIKPLYFNIKIPTELTVVGEGAINIVDKLKELGVKGYFIVRQPRIQTTLAQGLSVGTDRGSNIPMLYDEKKTSYFAESFLDTSRILTHTYEPRIMYTTNFQGSGLLSTDVSCSKILQSVFDGSPYVLEPFMQGELSQGTSARHKIISNYSNSTSLVSIKTGAVFIPEDTPLKYMWKKSFSTKVGSAEDVSQFGFFDYRDFSEINSRLVRGQYCSYIGVEDILKPNTIYSIKTGNANSLSLSDQIEIRGKDVSPFFAISHRYALDESTNAGIDVYRGDCYTSTVTIRLNRNFVDPTVPIYTDIIDPNTWRDNYKGYNNTISSNDSENDLEETIGQYSRINRADINSVALGTWVTYKCLSNYNTGIRIVDDSHSDEIGLLGSPRGFYPAQGIYALSKVPESSLLNAGLNVTLGHRQNFAAPNVPYIKEIFDSRVMFSKVQQNNAFKNSYRIFQGLDYQDIDRQYGAIVKFIPFGTNILSIFEHGVGIIPINEKALLSTSTGQSIHMYGAGVLQNQISVINEDFGSIWQDSIIRTPNGVYGVDTYAKKIWRVNASGQMEIISDMKVQRFLNDHIKLSEKDKYPIISLKNVKSHYNNYKGDVMFTFYNADANETWNLCYNERIGKWITRYSWTPLYSTNIDNIFYSLDQKRAKINALSYLDSKKLFGLKLGTGESYYINDNGADNEVDKTLELVGCDGYSITDITIASIESSYYSNNEEHSIDFGEASPFSIDNPQDNQWYLQFNRSTWSTIQGSERMGGYPAYFIVNLTVNLINGNIEKQIKDNLIPVLINYQSESNWNTQQKEVFVKNGFYIHGRAGIVDEINYEDADFDNQILPTKWYDKQEPFEFEFVVNDQVGLHKIFNNLVIISNNVQPNEIEYEIEGDVFKFNKTGVYRSEHFNESEWEIKYNKPKLLQKNTYSSLYQSTQEFKNCKIKWDVVLNSYTILLTQKCKNIEEFGRRLGNIQYKEDAWYITIDPILFKEKYRITDKENGNSVISEWSEYKSARLRDKYIKIRIKYTGEDIVIISALKTLITLSYA